MPSFSHEKFCFLTVFLFISEISVAVNYCRFRCAGNSTIRLSLGVRYRVSSKKQTESFGRVNLHSVWRPEINSTYISGNPRPGSTNEPRLAAYSVLWFFPKKKSKRFTGAQRGADYISIP